MSGIGNDDGWVCSICLSEECYQIGFKSILKTKQCGHIFHLECITKHFSIKNKLWEGNAGECILECPLCRS